MPQYLMNICILYSATVIRLSILLRGAEAEQDVR